DVRVDALVEDEGVVLAEQLDISFGQNTEVHPARSFGGRIRRVRSSIREASTWRQDEGGTGVRRSRPRESRARSSSGSPPVALLDDPFLAARHVLDALAGHRRAVPTGD